MVKGVEKAIRPVAPPAHKPKPILDIEGLLDAKTKLELREKAAARVLAREIEDAKEIYLQQQMDAAERARHPEIVEEMREILIDGPEYVNQVRLDGTPYYCGFTYTVTKRVYDSIKDLLWRAWMHDDEIANRKNSNQNRRAKNLTMSATGQMTDSSGRLASKF